MQILHIQHPGVQKTCRFYITGVREAKLFYNFSKYTKAAAHMGKNVKSSTIANLCIFCYNKSNYVKNYITKGHTAKHPSGLFWMQK